MTNHERRRSKENKTARTWQADLRGIRWWWESWVVVVQTHWPAPLALMESQPSATIPGSPWRIQISVYIHLQQIASLVSTRVKSSVGASLEWSMEELELAAIHSSATVCQFDKNCLSPKRQRKSVTFSNRTKIFFMVLLINVSWWVYVYTPPPTSWLHGWRNAAEIKEVRCIRLEGSGNVNAFRAESVIVLENYPQWANASWLQFVI